MKDPDFATLTKLEEKTLGAKLDAVRATITYSGETGRALEQAVMLLLRDMLPAEYGLSTGFVAYRSDGVIKLSRQIDIIIYDAVRTGPLARLTACDVFPLEAVYGYVEIKAALQSTSDSAEKYADNSIEQCLQQNQALRRMNERWYHTQSPESAVGSFREQGPDVSIRSYIVAFETDGKVAADADVFAQRIADFSRRLGDPTHVHGVFVANAGFFQTRPVSRKANVEEKWHVDYVTNDALAVFRADLLHSLARFPRFRADQTPALEDYYFAKPAWRSCAPKGSGDT